MDGRRLGSVLVALALVTTALGVAAASASPTPVCALCDGRFAATATDAGEPVEVESSEIRLHVDERGVGHWTVRTRVNDSAADRFADDPAALRSVARAALESEYVYDKTGYRNLSVAVDGDVLVFSYALPDMADREFGSVLLVDYFHETDAYSGTVRASGGLRLTGPEGTTVANDPHEATVSGDAVELSGYFDGRTYVAFAPDDDLANRATAAVVVVTRTGPTIVTGASLLALPSILVAGVFVGGYRVVHVNTSSWRAATLTRIAAGVGAVVVAGALFWARTEHGNGPALFVGFGVAAVVSAVGAGTLASATERFAGGDEPGADAAGVSLAAAVRRVALAPVAGVACGSWFASGLAFESGVLLGLLSLVPPVVLAFGVAEARDGRWRLVLGGALVAGPVVAAATFVPVSGLAILIFVMFLPLLTGVVLAAGAPLYFLGRALADEPPTAGGP